ncbi:hypothetical protein [Methylobacterium oryzihabitans]|uniref:Uncharacterized protein n=1 Tax=Methylobacterium oryzihabitans TaxID=2499852 RepID=A0A437P8W0_9HYPH|nr:hypothetical protein [Methylobacterium oryzihabitans]RVU18714.1 hypothetical protein EOE48_10030 [Methylobacterium oryzihabitans]
MVNALFEDIKTSLEEAITIARGERGEARLHVRPRSTCVACASGWVSYEIRLIARRSLRDRFAMRISASLRRRVGW